MALFAAVVLLGVGLAITQLMHGGSGVTTGGQPPAAAAAAGFHHSVIYEEFQLIWAQPGHPTVRAVIRSWTDSDGRTWRETVAGRPALEYGARYVRDPLMGPEIASYLYDGHTKLLYLTDTAFVPEQLRWHLSPPQTLRRELRPSSSPFHPAGTRVYAGHTVLAFAAGRLSPGHPNAVLYVDAHTYVPLFYEVNRGDKKATRIVARALAWNVLPANTANLRLANLTTSHPVARIVPEHLAHVTQSVYNTEPQHVPGLATAFESPPMIPLYWSVFSSGGLQGA